MCYLQSVLLTQTNKQLGAFARDIEYQANRLPDEIKKMEVGEGEHVTQSLQERTFGVRINCSRGWGMVGW